MAKIDTSFEGLFNLLLETQYLHACPKDLRIFLKQQGLSGQHDMVIMSANFLSSKPREFNRPSNVQSTGMRYNSNSNQHSFQQAPVSSRPPQTSSEYNATPRNYVGARQSQPPTCFLCAKVGHIAKDCQVQSPRADVNKRNTQPAHIGSVAIEQQSAHTISCPRDASFQCGCIAPEYGNACVRDCANLPTFEGVVNDHKVEVLRDSGCSTVVVKTSLINPNEFTGKHRQLILIDNSILQVPTAMCNIQSPFFTGRVEVLCIDQPVCDLIIGNINGIGVFKAFPAPPVSTDKLETTCDMEEVVINQVVPSFVDNSYLITAVVDECHEYKVSSIACAMITRAQSERTQKPMQPLEVRTPIVTSISAVDFRSAQLNDLSLDKYMYMADTEFPIDRRAPLASWFEVDDGLLYRLVNRGQDNDPVKQLMVPTSLRLSVEIGS